MKKYIIHLLGGITEEENNENQVNCIEIGEYAALQKIKMYMDSLNGKQADEWSKSVYGKVSKMIEAIER